MLVHPFILISLLLLGTQPSYQEVHALGQLMRLGQGYNENAGKFVNARVVNSNIPRNFTSVVPAGTMQSKYYVVESASDRTDIFNMDATTSVGVMSGIFNVQGSGRFLKEATEDSSCTVIVLKATFVTEKEYLEVDDEGFSQHVAKNGMRRATHFVISRTFGANVIFKFVSTVKNSISMSEIEGRMSAAGSVSLISAEAASKLEFKNMNRTSLRNTVIHVYSDVTAPITVRTPEDAVMYEASVWRALKESVGGRGVPIFYEIEPMSTLKENLGMDLVNPYVHDMNRENLDSPMLFIQYAFDKINVLKGYIRRKLRDFQLPCVTAAELELVERAELDFAITSNEFSALARSYHTNVTVNGLSSNISFEITQLLEDVKTMMIYLENMTITRNKIQLYKQATQEHNLIYLGRDSNIFPISVQRYQTFYAFYIPPNPVINKTLYTYFLSLQDKKKLVVDCSFEVNSCPSTLIQPVIHHWSFSFYDGIWAYMDSLNTVLIPGMTLPTVTTTKAPWHDLEWMPF